MNATIKRLTILAAVFAPFLMTGAALLVLPHPWETLRNIHGEDWIWLILLGGMMLGLYYFFGVYLEDEEEITEEFQDLDADHDGFISREDAKNWPELSREFDKFDRDHDGRLSHNDFELFEKARPEDEEEINEEFLRLDRNHDGFITREDAKNWPELTREFDKFDRDHDGRLSHNDFELFEFELFEKARPAH